MTPVTALLFCYRLPHLSEAEFKDYIENRHKPLVRSLLGADYPQSHTSYYTTKDSGFTIGAVTPSDADMIAIITYESVPAMEQSMRIRMSDGVREQIQGDEDKFMDRSKLKLVVLGEDDVIESIK